MRTFKVIVLTPPGLPEPSIAISATRAGGLGVLDLEYIQDKRAYPVVDALATLGRYAKDDYGIKLRSHPLVAEEVAELISELAQREAPTLKPNVVILTCPKFSVEHPDFIGDEDLRIQSKQVQALKNLGLTVLWESISLVEARFGVKCGVDGIIAKGHESGGRIGEETTFVLLQRLFSNISLPIYAQGGIGLHTASACYASKAAGVVLDSQLLLTKESPLPDEIKNRIAIMDGSETAYFGSALGEAYRVYSRPNIPAVFELEKIETKLMEDERPKSEILEEWRGAIKKRVGFQSLENLLFLGQDAAFAAPLADRFVTVGGIIEGIVGAIDSHVRTAHNLRPLCEGSPLCQSLGIRYPIFQGPMARIADTPSFAKEVADAGGLPFLALSLMPADELQQLLELTHQLLGKRKWGVGLIGFLPPDLFSAQLKVIKEARPPFALIAGGRPKQNRPLEEAGITTYMHVPSLGVLKIFLRSGDKRFILEGRESGGHVGPRTSFVLWEAMIDEILKHLSSSGSDASDFHLLFAGGIHDALSSCMVAVMAAPLAKLGVKVGVQMGTAYLFCEELVKTGGITDTYQKEALRCSDTVVLSVGPGHANRCICTPFAKIFDEEKKRLSKENKSPEEVRNALEQLSIGRLYVAAKGTTQVHTDEGPKIVKISEEEQLQRGVYMIGQVGAIKDKVYNIHTLHSQVSEGSTKLLKDLFKKHQQSQGESQKDERIGELPPSPPKKDIAIIGMASVMPGAKNKQEYWENILLGKNSIREVPKERWDWRLYYDPDPKAKDKVYSKWGCFIDPVKFDPVKYGMPPKSIPSIEPLQLITLEMVKAAIDDAGYSKRPFPRKRTSVIIGTGGGGADLAQGYGVRSSLPMLFGESSAEILSRFDGFLPQWTEDSFAGILMNVTAGRVANRFNLGGSNYTVDAACASSLAAVHLAVKELSTYSSDMVIVGGADTMQSAFAYLCFSKTMALSPTGECRPFDENADGIVLGEGVAILVLKRLEDAERDGDKIYAVIKAVGSSSDGRDKSMTAPRPEGQALALSRAYQRANVSPSTVELIEAHGTGTVVGDRAEIQALSQVFDVDSVRRQYCAIGSVKSQIGHTKCTAGVAGLMKAALALHHNVLPPTIGVRHPNKSANFKESPFYVNTSTRPWIDPGDGHPRRAGVSAFGFGGTNFHAVLEEYTSWQPDRKYTFPCHKWPSELFIWKGKDSEILEKISRLEKSLSAVKEAEQSESRDSPQCQPSPLLSDLAFSVFKEEGRNKQKKEKLGKEGEGEKFEKFSLAIVATSVDDLRQKLKFAILNLTKEEKELNDPRGIYYKKVPQVSFDGKVAFLFPGQGSQYVNMLMDLTVQFKEVRAHFERANRVLKEKLAAPLSRYIFPPPHFTEEERQAAEKALRETNIAQPAISAASMAMLNLLETFSVRPDFVAGHSYGEYIALAAGEVFDEDLLYTLSEARGRFIVESAGENPGTMAAINADSSFVSKVIEKMTPSLGAKQSVYIANKNSPKQTVITGSEEGITKATREFSSLGVRSKIIPVACAFHSPIVAEAKNRLTEFLSEIEISTPKIEVFSNTTAKEYPKDEKAIAEILGEHLVNCVEFEREIHNMYQAGARIFVEVGPNSILTKLVKDILKDKPHLAVASDQPSRNGLTQLQHLLGLLSVHGIPVKLNRFYQGRERKSLELYNLGQLKEKPPSPTLWLVNGQRAKPISEAKKKEPPFPQLNIKVASDERNESESRAHESQAHESQAHESHKARASNQRMLKEEADARSYLGEAISEGIPKDSSESLPHPRIFAEHQELRGTKQTEADKEVIAESRGTKQTEQTNDTPPISGEGLGFSEYALSPRKSQGEEEKSVAKGKKKPTDGGSRLIEPAEITNQFAHKKAQNIPAAQVMIQYQQLMNRFLDTQKSVMLTYLQSEGRIAVDKQTAELQGPFRGTRETKQTEADKEAEGMSLRVPQQKTEGQEDGLPLPLTNNHQSEPPTPITPTEVEHPDKLESKVAEVRFPEPVETRRIEPAEIKDISPPKKEGEEFKGELAERLLQIVSERTGYPKEMLDLDLDMEADLGIDSIKRIEILGSLQENYAQGKLGDDLQSNDAIEELANIKTLRGIVEWFENLISDAKKRERSFTEYTDKVSKEPRKDADTRPLQVEEKPEETKESVVNRYTLTAKEKPQQQYSRITLTNRVLVLTEDGLGGIAKQLAESLRKLGKKVALLKMGEKAQRESQGSYTADFRTSQGIADVLTIIRQQQGPIGGLIHLLPLKPKKSFDEMDLPSFREHLSLEVKSLFYFAKELLEELKEAAAEGDALFLAATAMGGTFASTTLTGFEEFFPGQGGVTGLLKAIAREWEDVRVKAIDLDASASASTQLHQLMQEITSDDGLIEVGYKNNCRYILSLSPAEVDKTKPEAFDIDSSWVILVTGGARGITADVAIELAKRYQPTLLLVGRSALPQQEEEKETAGVVEPGKLKAAIIQKMRKAGQTVTPAQVEAAYKRLNKDREMQRNLAEMRNAGAKVHYYQVDVSEPSAFSNLLTEIYQTYGRLDGVIHGAGIIEDKLVRDKTEESFNRVFDTKVESAFILSKKLKPEELSFFVIFSSVAGRFGNRGQSDYAAANEVYNKLAVYLDKRWPCRVVSVIWGPWARAGGMVSAELEKQFRKHGIELINRSVGPLKLDEELRYGRKGEVEVILGGRGWDRWKAEGGRRKTEGIEQDALRLPLISNSDKILREADGTVKLFRKLDKDRDIYLNDHKLDGKPVMPLAMAMELMAEVASLSNHNLKLSEISNLQVLKGIVLEDGRELELEVTAKPLNLANSRKEKNSQIEVSIASPGEPKLLHYRAKVELQKELP
ncbi:MAG: SDR family NAD(P)-dependent oxidoreductase, partial [Candidatus Poribacteria bacterium]